MRIGRQWLSAWDANQVCRWAAHSSDTPRLSFSKEDAGMQTFGTIYDMASKMWRLQKQNEREKTPNEWIIHGTNSVWKTKTRQTLNQNNIIKHHGRILIWETILFSYKTHKKGMQQKNLCFDFLKYIFFFLIPSVYLQYLLKGLHFICQLILHSI